MIAERSFWMKNYEVNQEITIPKADYIWPHPRKAVVLKEYPHFYLVLTKAGYKECISKHTADDYKD